MEINIIFSKGPNDDFWGKIIKMTPAIDVLIFNTLFGLSGRALWADWLIVAIAEYLPYFVILAVVYAACRSWQRGNKNTRSGYLLALISAGVARGIAGLIQFFYHHPRPTSVLRITSLFPETTYSFPSGHTILLFALAMGVYMTDKQFGRWLIAISALVAIARVAAGVHWPSDIVAGAILGIAIAYFLFKSWRNFFVKKF